MNAPQPITLIKAGAGAGKTYTIQKQLTEWVRNGHIAPQRILAVTFTKAAASEMRQRIRVDLMQEGLIEQANLVKEATINTIHAFGREILERFAWEQGFSPEPRQLTEHEQQLLMSLALNQITAVQPLIDNLEQYGYTGGYSGDKFIGPAEQLKKTMLDITNHLRALGKGGTGDDQEASALVTKAQEIVSGLYGATAEGQSPQDHLWAAIEAVKAEYPDKEALRHEWASNKETRRFVDAIYETTPERLGHDWSLWKKLQEVKGPQIKNERKGDHEHAHLAEAIWNAAEKLNVHPGPLHEALDHIQYLLEGTLEALGRYQARKTESGLIDYGDMVYIADAIFAVPEWRQEITRQYDCLIIDEFQDTNPLQYALLEHLRMDGIPTFIVGDLKQSIMGFQGADPRLFNALIKQQEKATDANVQELESNWRSTPALMKFINPMGEALFGEEYQPLAAQAGYSSQLDAVHILSFDKQVWKNGTKGNKPDLYREGMLAMANHLYALLESEVVITDSKTGEQRAIQPADIAVLGRTHTKLQAFAEALRQVGIRPQLKEPGLFECASVQWVLNALQWLTNPNDQYAVLSLLTSPVLNGHHSEVLEAQLTHRIQKGSLDTSQLEALESRRSSIALMPVADQLRAIIECSGLEDKLQDWVEGEQERVNVVTLLGLAETFQQQQPETLHAQGLYGHNAATFQVWLEENRKEFDTQAVVDPNAADAVTLTTWHKSKGLEWPVVLVLQTEDVKAVNLPATDMAYQSDDACEMLSQSYVRILPNFADKQTQSQVMTQLLPEHDHANRNLYYVAMTRAREQLILPWFSEPKDGSLLHRIQGLFDQGTPASFDYTETVMTAANAEHRDPDTTQPTRTTFAVTDQSAPEAIQSTVTPSLGNTPQAAPSTSEELSYGPALPLETLRQQVSANELGSWVHRLYQTHLKNPEIIERALALAPVEQLEDEWEGRCREHLIALEQTLREQLGMIHSHCEHPILAQNHQGQTISGVIDLLAEADNGYWVIDHKTDTENDANKHWNQINAYAECLRLEKPVLGLAINWTQHGTLETLPF